jgi:hypothetical protein
MGFAALTPSYGLLAVFLVLPLGASAPIRRIGPAIPAMKRAHFGEK